MKISTSKNVAAVFGLLFTFFLLFILLCPACALILGAFEYFDGAETWNTEDEYLYAFFACMGCMGILVAVIVGGWSCYQLFKPKDEI